MVAIRISLRAPPVHLKRERESDRSGKRAGALGVYLPDKGGLGFLVITC